VQKGSRPHANKPTPNVSGPTPNVSGPTPNVSGPTLNVSGPTPNVSELNVWPNASGPWGLTQKIFESLSSLIAMCVQLVFPEIWLMPLEGAETPTSG
jgi:hypothetical protein